MIDFLYNIDKSLFYFINGTLSNPLFDKIFPFITDVKHWFIAYIILWLALVIKGDKHARIVGFGAILLIALSDQISSNLLKNYFGRIRPCNVLPDVNILVFCSGSFSFPSSHAVNNFAVAAYFVRFFPKYKTAFYTVAVLMAFSRPYVGVHYPSDVIFGSIIGFLIGYLFAELLIFLEQKWIFNDA